MNLPRVFQENWGLLKGFKATVKVENIQKRMGTDEGDSKDPIGKSIQNADIDDQKLHWETGNLESEFGLEGTRTLKSNVHHGGKS